MRRRARWLMLLPLLIGLLGLSGSALAVRSADPRIAVLTTALPDVSRLRGTGSTSFWLVRQGETWRAFTDRGSGWRTCRLRWDQNGERFADLCGVGLWDSAGRVLGGVAPRNLDQYAVTPEANGYVTVDLSRITEGAPSPLQVLRQYLSAGKPDQAWPLIHPDRQSDAAYERFRQAVTADLSIERIEGQRRLQTWDDQLTQHGIAGGRTWSNVQELQIRWDNGEPQTIHFVLDEEGAWRLLWSPAFALE